LRKLGLLRVGVGGGHFGFSSVEDFCESMAATQKANYRKTKL